MSELKPPCGAAPPGLQCRPVTDSKPAVLLLYPKTGMDFGSTIAPPHALLAIAAPVLKAGYSVEYNGERLHASIAHQTPSAVYWHGLGREALPC